MNIFFRILVSLPFVALFSVMIILAFGPAYIESRDWWRQKKSDEYEQKHGYKPHKKTGGHF